MGPGVYSALQCVSTPAVGGETLFASSAALYAALSAEQRAFADAAVAVHRNRYTGGGPAAVDGECGLRMDATGTRRVRAATERRPGWSLNESRAPLTALHARSGRHVMVGGGKNLDHLLVPPADGDGTASVALDAEESAARVSELLLAGLRPSAVAALDPVDGLPAGRTCFAPDAVLELRWRPGDIVIWDNQALLHSTTPVCLYGDGQRLFRHVIGTDVRRGAAAAAGGDYGTVQRDAFFLGAAGGQ